MTPQVSRAAGRVINALSLTSGPTLDELVLAAEQANNVEELPKWALNVLAVLPPDPSP